MNEKVIMVFKILYNGIIENRKKNPLKKGNGTYVETHHIVPRCLGGKDDKDNLINLTAKEHFCCHYLLMKMYSK